MQVSTIVYPKVSQVQLHVNSYYIRSAVMIVEANGKFQTFQLPLKYPALKQSVPLCYVINLCLKGNVKHKLHLLRVESCMRLLTVNHFNFIAANQVLRKLKNEFRGVPYEPPPISATVKLCYTFGLKWHSFLPPHCLGPIPKKFLHRSHT